ncbi:hypothetical protein K402DRAFT_374675 [Aulographum hederae CBS 113979]|uniref:Uncharacterized protein n=1 Tax=Aulographum hederae CBS 113979 TaxID=1176131 RepID=A0A6G1H4W6_9PEZI|nr:hypothetical protein K402DRAFT_374675 [Aulographum hederae CBS 113979]
MKSFAYLSVFSALASSVVAVPAGQKEKRAEYTVNDGLVLNYALTLEHLEGKFYREGLQNFTKQNFLDAGYNETFYNNLLEISYDETQHVSFLTGALQAAGIPPVPECTYAFGITSLPQFLATASLLEGVGVSAYLGAADSIATKAYLTAAGSILTVEARHSSYLRQGLKTSPFAQPYDAPLDFNMVFTLAAPFIKSCPPGAPTLPFTAFPGIKLSADSPTPVTTGSAITLVTDGYILNEPSGVPLFAVWIAATGPVYVPATLMADGMHVDTVVPPGVHGQSYVVLSGCRDYLADDVVAAGPGVVEVAGANGMP